MHDDGFPRFGFVTIKDIVSPGPVPYGKSTFWAGVKSGRFPAPIRLSPRRTVWRVEDIRKLIHELSTPSAVVKADID
jgi:hypothetical protein